MSCIRAHVSWCTALTLSASRMGLISTHISYLSVFVHASFANALEHYKLALPAHVRCSATSQQEYVCTAWQRDESEYEGVPGHHVSCLGLVQLAQYLCLSTLPCPSVPTDHEYRSWVDRINDESISYIYRWCVLMDIELS